MAIILAAAKLLTWSTSFLRAHINSPVHDLISIWLVVSLQKRALAEMEQSGLIPLVQQDKLEDLGRMYTLFRRVDAGAELMRQVRALSPHPPHAPFPGHQSHRPLLSSY